MMAKMPNNPNYGEKIRGLTERQKQIVRFVACGLSDAEMARALQRSPHTIAAHLRTIMATVGITKRTALAAEAVRAGIA
jgi:DNA-binding NarL/FixJ family response regulator